MRRFFIWLGVFLMIFAFVVLFTLIILPAVISSFDSVPPLKSTFQLLFCTADETLQDSRSTFTSPGTTVTTLHLACVDKEGNGRDISNDRISVGVVGYLVPLLVGLFMTLLAASREKSGFRRSVQADRSPTAAGSRGRPKDKEMAHSKQQESATVRLKELKSALDAGLITQAEYDAKHKEILDDM
jgi:hypothetical protein